MRENNLEETIMEHLKNFFVLIVMIIGTVMMYCGWAFLGIVSKIMEWFA